MSAKYLEFRKYCLSLHPNSENPMHSTTVAPVIEAQFRPKDVIRNF